MKLLTNFFLICILASGQLIHGQTATFSSNFEDRNTAAETGSELLETSNGGFKVVPNPSPDAVNSSNYVLKSYLLEGKGRAEYSAQRHETNEKKYIYTWKRYHKANTFKDINVGWGLFNQWKTWPCEAWPVALPEYDKYQYLICGAGGIFNEIDFEGGDNISYWARAEPDCYRDHGKIPEGSWNEFVLEVYWTNTNKGYYRIWRNNVLFGHSDNIKTLFDQFQESNCDIYWSNGLYAYWDKTGGRTQDSLIAFIDDIAIYDIDKGFDISDICPDCEGVPPTICSSVNWVTSAKVTNVTKYEGKDGAIDFTVSGGSGAYTYLWNNGAKTQDITGLTAGAYNVTVTDNSGCTVKASYTITQPANPCDATVINLSGVVTPDTLSKGVGAINISKTGGSLPYTYAWSNGKTVEDIAGLKEGSYSVTVTDNNGCFSTKSFSVTNYNPCATTNIIINGSVIPDTSAKGVGSIDISVTGGLKPYTYLWGKSGATSQDISGLKEGSYSVTVTDKNGCFSAKSFVVGNIIIEETNNSPVPDINFESSAYQGMLYTLDASNSYDPDNEVISYKWTIPEEISSSSVVDPIISILPTEDSKEKVYNISLAVSDAKVTAVKNISVGIYKFRPDAHELRFNAIEASSYSGLNYPENLLDNNTNSLWTSEGDGEWVIFELANKALVTHFELFFSNGIINKSYFDIFGSIDKKNWELILENSTSCGFSPSLHTFAMPETKSTEYYKYIKLVGHMNSGDKWNSFSEFKAFGIGESSSGEQITELNKEHIFDVYPNPAENFVYISNSNGALIQFVNIEGKVVFEKYSHENVTQINCDFAPGLYLINVIKDGGSMHSKKLIIK